jgi:hypothetical protein
MPLPELTLTHCLKALSKYRLVEPNAKFVAETAPSQSVCSLSSPLST